MKRRWLFISVLLLSITSCGRTITSSALPEPVKTSFQSQFPMAQNAEWKSSGNQYKVNFHNFNQYMYAKYKEDGTLKKAIPQSTASSLDSN